MRGEGVGRGNSGWVHGWWARLRKCISVFDHFHRINNRHYITFNREVVMALPGLATNNPGLMALLTIPGLVTAGVADDRKYLKVTDRPVQRPMPRSKRVRRIRDDRVAGVLAAYRRESSCRIRESR